MKSCWDAIPGNRPTFSVLSEGFRVMMPNEMLQVSIIPLLHLYSDSDLLREVSTCSIAVSCGAGENIGARECGIL